MMINHHSFDNTPLGEVLNTPGDHSVPSGLNLAKKSFSKSLRESWHGKHVQKHIYIQLQERGTNPLLNAETYRH